MSDSATPRTVAPQAPPFMGFSRQEYWSGLPCPPPRDLPDLRIEPESPAAPALASRFFTAEPPGKTMSYLLLCVHPPEADTAPGTRRPDPLCELRSGVPRRRWFREDWAAGPWGCGEGPASKLHRSGSPWFSCQGSAGCRWPREREPEQSKLWASGGDELTGIQRG